MFKFMLKSGTYLFLIKKFKHEIVSMIISLLSIWLIFGISNDFTSMFQIKDSDILFYILLIKWSLIFIVILYNIKLIKSIKSLIKESNEIKKDEILPEKSQEILNKKIILTRTDIILKRYTQNESI